MPSQRTLPLAASSRPIASLSHRLCLRFALGDNAPLRFDWLCFRTAFTAWLPSLRPERTCQVPVDAYLTLPCHPRAAVHSVTHPWSMRETGWFRPRLTGTAPIAQVYRQHACAGDTLACSPRADLYRCRGQCPVLPRPQHRGPARRRSS